MTQDKFVFYDDVLPKDVFKTILEGIEDIPWYYTKNVTSIEVEKVCYFTHCFYKFEDNKVYKSDWYYLLEPVLEILNCKSLLRMKGNLYPRTDILHHNLDHVDYHFPHNGAIFYLNTCDGFTVIDNEHYIESVENRLLFFDSTIPHHSTNCTDEQVRVNINFNYF